MLYAAFSREKYLISTQQQTSATFNQYVGSKIRWQYDLEVTFHMD